MYGLMVLVSDLCFKITFTTINAWILKIYSFTDNFKQSAQVKPCLKN